MKNDMVSKFCLLMKCWHNKPTETTSHYRNINNHHRGGFQTHPYHQISPMRKKPKRTANPSPRHTGAGRYPESQ
ncbi:MAG: hypothetical protein COB30_015430 [Ectothiorhodospiraceae bacterium]|nr:hypothetical protein [Ectothiorhodospiraceae bacterium]